MDLMTAYEPLKALTAKSLEAIAQAPLGFQRYRRATAFFDTSKDEMIVRLETFGPAVEAISQTKEVKEFYGSHEARRIALQFVYTACTFVTDVGAIEDVFEITWARFRDELSKPTWSFKGVANLQNIECAESSIGLGAGVTICARRLDDLAHALGWGQYELDALAADWQAGASSSHVLLVEQEIPKTPDNFLLENDGSELVVVARMLLAMRLSSPGDLRIGRIFHARPASFNVGLGGLLSSGHTIWHPGPKYHLDTGLVQRIMSTYKSLASIEVQSAKASRTLNLALRSFSSIYDRLWQQSEDRIVDAITSLEAIWRINAELSFRLAFRTASVLAMSDDERVEILDTLVKYYRIRSKVVHGGSLTSAEETSLFEDETLREIVRRTLNAFLYLSANPGQWTVEKLIGEADRTLVHADKRRSLQAAMGIVGSSF